MRYKVLFFLIVLSKAIAAQAQLNPDPLHTGEREMIKANKVHTSCSKEYNVINGKEVPIAGYDSMIYNQQGSLMREAWMISFDTHELSLDIYSYLYNQNGLVSEARITTYDSKGVVEEVEYEQFLYNASGKISKSFRYDGSHFDELIDSTVYTYNGNLLEQVKSPWGTCHYEHRNDTIFEYTLYEHELTKGYVNENVVFDLTGDQKYTYKYNSEGLFAGSIRTDKGKKTFESFWEYEKGLPVKITSYEDNKQTVEHYTYTYYK